MNAKNIIKGLLISVGVSIYSISSAATLDHFEIKLSPTTAKVGESIDMTIKAVDKDNNVVKDYTGGVIILSESDDYADFPGVLSDQIYIFKAADAGDKKFENAVKFSKIGTQDIGVYDNDNDTIFGVGKVEITSKGAVVEKKDISITSPENGTTIGTSSFKVSGQTEKNHKVKITINTDKTFETQTDENGFYEIEVKDIENGENLIQSYLLDADKNEIGESEISKIMIENNAPRFKSITLTPAGELTPETTVNVEVLATKGLQKVNLILNESIELLQEVEDGKYTGVITSPVEAGEYKVDVNLTDELGHNTKASSVAIIKVKALESAKEEVVKKEEPKTEEPKTEVKKEVKKEEPTSENSLEIKGIKLTKLKTKSILSWDMNKNAESYNIYKKDETTGEFKLMTNTTEPRFTVYIKGDVLKYEDFAVKAQAKKGEQTVQSKDYSEITKIKTGPGQILLVLMISLLLGLVIIKRKKA